MTTQTSYKQASFNRKLIYGIGIAVLLYPLALLSRPATLTDPEGGVLSDMRSKNGLSQANLGEIDPASETMKLATLGLRGLAVNLLWGKAEEFKKKEDWTNLTATLEQLAMLQPNFITFWKYQSWNVAYNVSVQFDDYRDRYYYVREGIQFLEQGVEKNRENRDIPQLLWDLGWFIGQKIGRADEHVQYRRLFKNDDEYHGDEPPPGSDERDNWLVSKLAYLDCVSSIQDRGKSIGKKSEKIVYSSPAKSQMSYATAIEEEGEFRKGQAAWTIAADDWRDFGDRWIEHSTGRRLQLGHEDELGQAIDAKVKELDALGAQLRDEIAKEKREALTAEQKAALAKPRADRSQEEAELAYATEQSLEVTDQELVERLAEVNPEVRKQASLLAAWIADKRVDFIYTQRYKNDANYDYWELRAEFEQKDAAVDARRHMFNGKKAFADDQNTEEAKSQYEQGFKKWREVLDTYPDLQDPDGTTGDDLMIFVTDYRKVLRSVGEEIPDDFPLWDIIENFDLELDFQEELQAREIRLRQESGEDAPDEEAGEAPEPSEAADSDDSGSADSAAQEESEATTEESANDSAVPEESTS